MRLKPKDPVASPVDEQPILHKSRNVSSEDRSKLGSTAEEKCPSGAPEGLCSCRVVVRAGIKLLSGACFGGSGAAGRGRGDGSTDNNIIISSSCSQQSPGTTNRECSSSERWLARVAAIHGNLSLSLYRPSTLKTANLESSDAGERNCGENVQHANGYTKMYRNADERFRQGVKRSRFSLSADWNNWNQLGYGPLQWMSFQQKAFLGRLALSWVTFQKQEEYVSADEAEVVRFQTNKRAAAGDFEVCSTCRHPRSSERLTPVGDPRLQFRPRIAAVTRLIDVCLSREQRQKDTPTPCEAALLGTASPSLVHQFHMKDIVHMSSRIAYSSRSATPTWLTQVAESANWQTIPSKVVVRDEGRSFKVEVEMEEDAVGVGRERCREVRRLEGVFGVEGWQGTGLGELLWMNFPWREYLARRLTYQVRLQYTRQRLQ